MNKYLTLTGLDGANPLAYLALLGVASLAKRFNTNIRISWIKAEGAWRPQLFGFDGSKIDLAEALHRELALSPIEPFCLDKKLPFSRLILRNAMQNSLISSNLNSRATLDILAGLGTDAHEDENGAFLETALRMVRSGDSAGQGLLAYAAKTRQTVTPENIYSTLFKTWQYNDEGFSFRWDPIEDQRYALRWHDPSAQSKKNLILKTEKGANALAIEALSILPVQPTAQGSATTGFLKSKDRRDHFNLPIWNTAISTDIIRSIVSNLEIAKEHPNRALLNSIGIVEIYRCERIAPNKYYKNFTPAQPA